MPVTSSHSVVGFPFPDVRHVFRPWPQRCFPYSEAPLPALSVTPLFFHPSVFFALLLLGVALLLFIVGECAPRFRFRCLLCSYLFDDGDRPTWTWLGWYSPGSRWVPLLVLIGLVAIVSVFFVN